MKPLLQVAVATCAMLLVTAADDRIYSFQQRQPDPVPLSQSGPISPIWLPYELRGSPKAQVFPRPPVYPNQLIPQRNVPNSGPIIADRPPQPGAVHPSIPQQPIPEKQIPALWNQILNYPIYIPGKNGSKGERVFPPRSSALPYLNPNMLMQYYQFLTNALNGNLNKQSNAQAEHLPRPQARPLPPRTRAPTTPLPSLVTQQQLPPVKRLLLGDNKKDANKSKHEPCNKQQHYRRDDDDQQLQLSFPSAVNIFLIPNALINRNNIPGVPTSAPPVFLPSQFPPIQFNPTVPPPPQPPIQPQQQNPPVFPPQISSDQWRQILELLKPNNVPVFPPNSIHKKQA